MNDNKMACPNEALILSSIPLMIKHLFKSEDDYLVNGPFCVRWGLLAVTDRQQEITV